MKTKIYILSKLLLITFLTNVVSLAVQGQGNTLKLVGNNNVTVDSKIGSINNADLNFITNNTLRLKITKGGNINMYGDLNVTGMLNCESININKYITVDSIHVRVIKIGNNSLYIGGNPYPGGTSNNIQTTDGLINLTNQNSPYDNITVSIGKLNGTVNSNIKLDVAGDINVSINKGYRINDKIVLQNTGSQNIFVGEGAGVDLLNTGTSNSFFGFHAGFKNTLGSNNLFIGSNAGLNNTTGTNNSFIGSSAGTSNTIGSSNLFIGNEAGFLNTSGNYNLFLGTLTGYDNTSGSYNSFLGYLAGRSNTTGYYNSFFGSSSGVSNTTGYSNSIFGSYAGFFNTTGNQNSFFGYKAGFSNDIGHHNLFLGYGAGFNNITGYNNSYIGNTAGFNNITGSNNTYIGNYADGNNAGDLSNSTAIGANSLVEASNCMVFGAPDGTFPEPVKVGIGTTTPHNRLEIVSNISLPSLSGLRLTSLKSYVPTTNTNYALTVDVNGDVILANVVGIMPPPTIPDPPTLNLPADGADVFREDVGLNLFSWYAVANGCYYSVYISSSNDPTDETAIVYKQTTTDIYVLSYLTVATGATYYWWVKALNGCQSGNISEIRSFNYQILPEPPKLIPSDSIFKTNITPLTDALVKTLQLNGKYFNWNTVDYPSFNDTTRNIGLIAQEVQPIIPEVVKADAQGHLFMNYSQLVPVLIEAVKELNTKNATLTTVTDSLKTVIANYENRFANIEAMLSNCCQNSNAKSINTNSGSANSMKEYDNTEISSVIHITPDNSVNSPVTELYQNRPNPFTTKTTFTYQLGKAGFVELEIHSEIGAYVAKLVDMNQEEGSFSIDWNTNEIAPGIYFYSLKVDGQLWVKKAVRIR